MRPLVWNCLFLLAASILLVPADSHPYIIWEMLSYPQSAKSAAVAGAVSSLPGDYTAMVYNPATLGFCRHVEIYGTYSRHEVMFGPGHYIFGGVIYPTGTLGTFGADLTYRLSAEMTWVDPYGTPRQTWRDHWLVARLSYGKRLMNDLAVGAAAEFIRLRYPWLPDHMEFPEFAIAKGLAFDASLLYRTPIPNANIGISLLNLGPDIEFTKQGFSSELPIELRGGISSTPVRNRTHKLMFGFDMARVFENPEQVTIHLGAEYTLLNIVSLRMGYLRDFKELYIDRNGITFGFGVRIAGLFSIDVADMSHIFDPYYHSTRVYLTGHLEVPFPSPRRPGED